MGVEPPQNGCRPADASFYPTPVTAGPSGYYLKTCQTDSDCVRATNRMAHVYTCDPGLRGCVPVAQTNVTIGPDAPIIPFCGFD